MPHDSTWFKFYDDFFTHKKSRRLTNDQQRVVMVCWCIASRSHERGVLWATGNLPAVPGDIADDARLPIEVVKEALGTPENRGPVTQLDPTTGRGMWLDWRPDGLLYFPNWNDEQPTIKKDPTNSERQARYRKNKREKRSPPVPDG